MSEVKLFFFMPSYFLFFVSFFFPLPYSCFSLRWWPIPVARKARPLGAGSLKLFLKAEREPMRMVRLATVISVTRRQCWAGGDFINQPATDCCVSNAARSLSSPLLSYLFSFSWSCFISDCFPTFRPLVILRSPSCEFQFSREEAPDLENSHLQLNGASVTI